MITGRKKRTALHAKINGEKEDYTNCLSLSLSATHTIFRERERERDDVELLDFGARAFFHTIVLVYI